MDLLDRLLGHDAWTTRQLLVRCRGCTDEQLDREFDLGHRSVRATFEHLIRNMEVWGALMAEQSCEPFRQRAKPASVEELLHRLEFAADCLAATARRIAADEAWDETWTDHLEDPPQEKTYGAAIAHIITHSMHHRAQLLYLLRRVGLTDLPEGDVFSWERRQ